MLIHSFISKNSGNNNTVVLRIKVRCLYSLIQYLTQYISHFKPDLGDGWGPAVINYQTEFKFIRLHVAEVPQALTFYIGGSTFGTGPENAIEHFEYLATTIGKTINR